MCDSMYMFPYDYLSKHTLCIIHVKLMIAIIYIDLNECEDSPCEQDCENKEGSFTCACQNGCLLNDDQLTCSGEYCGSTCSAHITIH